MKKINVLLATAIAAVAVTLSGCGKSGGGRPDFGDNEYPVLTVGVETAQTQTTYPATIKGVQDVEIRPKVSGFITKFSLFSKHEAAGKDFFRICRIDGILIDDGLNVLLVESECRSNTHRIIISGLFIISDYLKI